MGSFAEARRRLIAKIEGCEDTHQYMRSEYVAKRGVNPDNYYRLNVEVGVGEFGMNEWNQLAEISTSTRRYLAKPEVRRINEDVSAKMGRIERAKRRHTAYTTAGELDGYENSTLTVPPPLDPLAVELPGDEGPPHYTRTAHQNGHTHPQYTQVMDAQGKFAVLSPTDRPQTPRESQIRRSAELQAPGDNPRTSSGSIVPSPRRSQDSRGRPEPPPLPPKTPIQYPDGREGAPHRISPRGNTLPYPDDDGPPPMVNMARKPEYVAR